LFFHFDRGMIFSGDEALFEVFNSSIGLSAKVELVEHAAII
jgi:hypothetical protein